MSVLAGLERKFERLYKYILVLVFEWQNSIFSMRILNDLYLAVDAVTATKTSTKYGWLKVTTSDEPESYSSFISIIGSILYFFPEENSSTPESILICDNLQVKELDEYTIHLHGVSFGPAWYLELRAINKNKITEWTTCLRGSNMLGSLAGAKSIDLINFPPGSLAKKRFSTFSSVDQARDLNSIHLDDSPNFRLEIDKLYSNIESIRSKQKRTLEACMDYFNSMSHMVRKRNCFLDALENTIPPNTTKETSLSNYNRVSRKLIEAVKDHSSLETMKLALFQSSIVEPIRQYVEVDLKNAKNGKHKLSKLREKYNACLANYLNMKDDTAALKLLEAEDNLHKINQEFAETRSSYFSELKQLELLDSARFSDQLLNWVFDIQAFYESGFNRCRKLGEFVLDVENKLQKWRKIQDKEKRNSIQNFEKNRLNSVPEYSIGWKRKDGYLFKRTSNLRKEWKQRWFSMESGKIFYRSLKGISDQLDEHQKESTIDLVLASVRIPQNTGKRFCFEILSASPQKTFFLQASNEDEYSSWISSIQHNIGVCLEGNQNIIGSSPVNVAKENYNIVVKELQAIPGNNLCADCGAAGPDWVALNLGVLICIDCAGIHRNMGAHISKMRSLTLDSIDEVTLKMLSIIGNHQANSVWQYSLTDDKINYFYSKRGCRIEMEKHIRNKYEKGLYLASKITVEKIFEACRNGNIIDLMSGMAFLNSHPNFQIEELRNPKNGRHLIHELASRGYIYCFEYLLLNGINIDLVDSNGDSCLHLAKMNSEVEMENFLHSRNANTTLQNLMGITPENVVASHTRKEQDIEVVVSLYAFKGIEQGDLSFEVGEKIQVVSKDESGWWTGRIRDSVGLFPANYTNCPHPFLSL